VYEASFESSSGVRFFESRLVPEKTGGQVRSIVSTSRDITARKELEDSIRASLDEKVILLKEIHHRVKNNLQVMSSLLNLQAGSTADPEARERLRESQGRIRIMALIHEKLYESRDLAGADAVDYLRKLVSSAFYAYDGDSDRIRAHVDGDPIQLDADTALPLGLLVNELVTNAMKHAFPGGRPGTIEIELRRNGAGTLQLRVADDGIGMPADLERGGSLGLQLVDALVGQLDGSLAITRVGGTRVDITLSIPRYKQRF